MHAISMSTPWAQDFFATQEENTQDASTAQDPQERYAVDPVQSFPASSIPVPIDFNPSAASANRPTVFNAPPLQPDFRPPALSPPSRYGAPSYPFAFQPSPPFAQQQTTLPPVLPRSDGLPYYTMPPALPSPLDARPPFGYGTPGVPKGKAGGAASAHAAPSPSVLMPSVAATRRESGDAVAPPFVRDAKTELTAPPSIHMHTAAARAAVEAAAADDEDDWPPDNRIGRQRVMTKCPNCQHSNHIRRKICQKCSAPKPPPAKRKRRRKRKSIGAFRGARAAVPGMPGGRIPLPDHRFLPLEHAAQESAYRMAPPPPPPPPFETAAAQSHIGESVLGMPGGRQIVDPQSAPIPPLPQPGAFGAGSSSIIDTGQSSRSAPRQR